MCAYPMTSMSRIPMVLACRAIQASDVSNINGQSAYGPHPTCHDISSARSQNLWITNIHNCLICSALSRLNWFISIDLANVPTDQVGHWKMASTMWQQKQAPILHAVFHPKSYTDSFTYDQLFTHTLPRNHSQMQVHPIAISRRLNLC